MGNQFGQCHGLGFGDGLFAGAFQDAVPRIGTIEGAGSVQGGAEPAEQGGVPELNVADVVFRGADAGHGRLMQPVPVGRLQPGHVEAVQEAGRVRRRAAGSSEGEVDDGLHDVGVVGGGPGTGFDHLQ